MSSILTAKTPNLSMLPSSPIDDFDYPLMLDKNNKLHVYANGYILKFGGGVNSYGVRPVPSTIKTRARSLAIFLNYIENKNLSIFEITDNHIINYTNYLPKNRNINDNQTTKTHVRVALDYLLYIQDIHKDKNLITSDEKPKKIFNVHITILTHSRFSIEYIDHSAITNLVSLSDEVSMASDTQFYLWTDAIYNTSNHPEPSDELILRWESMSFLLEGAGSRISELYLYTRSQIKDAYKPLGDANEMVNLKNIPITKGKYKGHTRKVKIANGTLQYIMSYIEFIESKWPCMDHDQLFVNVENGNQLAASYFKKYSEKVIKQSTYKDELAGITNHSFRHRFVTLNIVKNLNMYKDVGNYTNILAIAMKAVRKLTMHASDDTLSEYVHLALEYISDKKNSNNTKNAPDRLIFTQIKDSIARFNHGSKNAEETVLDIESALKGLLFD